MSVAEKNLLQYASRLSRLTPRQLCRAPLSGGSSWLPLKVSTRRLVDLCSNFCARQLWHCATCGQLYICLLPRVVRGSCMAADADLPALPLTLPASLPTWFTFFVELPLPHLSIFHVSFYRRIYRFMRLIATRFDYIFFFLFYLLELDLHLYGLFLFPMASSPRDPWSHQLLHSLFDLHVCFTHTKNQLKKWLRNLSSYCVCVCVRVCVWCVLPIYCAASAKTFAMPAAKWVGPTRKQYISSMSRTGGESFQKRRKIK